MELSKTQLKKRYLKAVRKLERERDIIQHAQSRRHYWAKILKSVEGQLQLAKDGQLDLPLST